MIYQIRRRFLRHFYLKNQRYLERPSFVDALYALGFEELHNFSVQILRLVTLLLEQFQVPTKRSIEYMEIVEKGLFFWNL